MIACKRGDESLVRLTVSKGCNVNAKDGVSVADLGFEQGGVHGREVARAFGARENFLPTTPTLVHFCYILTSTQFHYSNVMVL